MPLKIWGWWCWQYAPVRRINGHNVLLKNADLNLKEYRERDIISTTAPIETTWFIPCLEKSGRAYMRRIKRFLLRLLLIIIVFAMVGGLACVLINSRVIRTTEDKIIYTVMGDVEIKSFAVENLKNFNADCIMVLGCGIEDEETPSPMLRDRLDVGIELYKQGAAPKILLTGDNGTEQHNEIHVMLKYTKEAGVPEKDIFCDHAGFSTYDSMYRAASIFNAEKVIVVTQTYHQYRALYIGEKLGIDVMGVASDQETYFGQSFRESREILARIKDFFKAMLRSKPTYGGEVIPISGSGISSHGE